jgi:hypothetical protein
VIVAGRYDEVRDFCRTHNVPLNRVAYASSEQSVRGLSEPVAVVTGTGRLRNDYNHIVRNLKRANAVILNLDL